MPYTGPGPGSTSGPSAEHERAAAAIAAHPELFEDA